MRPFFVGLLFVIMLPIIIVLVLPFWIFFSINDLGKNILSRLE